MEEYWYWICSIRGLYRDRIRCLTEYFGDPRYLFYAKEKEIASLPILNEAEKKALVQAKNNTDIDKEYHNRRKKGIDFISIGHPAYPPRLKEIPDPPFGLFYKGKLPEEKIYAVAIIGARRCSTYGRQMAENLGEKLAARGIPIISGMALGVDGYGQCAALRAGGESYGVLGSGVDICYPKRNRDLYNALAEQGGILSEYPPGTQPLPVHFPMRNRIISGLSDVVIVVEAKVKSGSLITADCALEQGRDVYVVPGRMNDELSMGSNLLIAQGAGIITGVDALLKELGLEGEKESKNKKNKITLETKENLVYSCLDFNSKSLNQILSATNLQVKELAGVLISLQLKGLVKESAKNFYEKI
ncbi:DNA-processing protein DprA [uncultured Robinsoniella sp.]|uniref:DNA-processing protein DprA n=1 Tax=uncultured Robinsoniella sp. TaxID=904190 RepID=UPI00374F12D8